MDFSSGSADIAEFSSNNSDAGSDFDSKFEYSEDDMKRVIVNCVSNFVKDEAITSLQNLPPKNKATVLPLLHCMINNNMDKNACLGTIAQLLSDHKGGTALHYAADQDSYILIAPLLDYGLDPNIRCAWNDKMNRALPLNVVLDLMASEISEAFPGKLSAFKLVCEICSSHWRPSLECIRLLAPRTRELNEEIINYMKQGKVIELCALMLLGYDSRVAAVLDFVELDDSSKEEQVLQLIQTFARIGDKLQTYVALKSSPFGRCVSGMVSEIASMFNDAGLPLSNGDNLVYHGRYILELKEKARSEFLSSMRDCSGPTVHDATLGSRSLHTSSVLKAQKRVMHSSQLKGFVLPNKPQFWWNPSSLMMAVRRVARHV